MANNYGLGMEYDIDLFKQALENATMDTGQKMRKAAGYNPYGPGKINQANQGDNNGTINGSSTTKSAVNSGTGVQEPPKLTLGDVPSVDQITNIARGNTTYTSGFGSDPMIHTLSGDRVPLQTVNENRYVAGNDGGNPSLGQNVFTDTNVDKAALAKRVNTVDSDAMSRLMGNNSGGSRGGGGGNQSNSIDDQVDQIDPQRMLEDFKKQKERDSYEQDLKDYYSGDLRSSGYGRIRSERMNLQSQIDDNTRGLPPVQKAQVAAEMMGNYTKYQAARLGLNAEEIKANSNENIASNKIAQDYDDSNKRNLVEKERQKFNQNKEQFNQFNTNRQFDLDLNRFVLDTEKAALERQYKLGQLGLDETRVNQSQAELGLKANDYASQAEKRKADIMLGQTEGLRKAYETGQEPIKNAANIMKQEGGLSSLPAAARVQLLRSLGLDPALIDPEGYAAVQQQTGK